MELVIVERSFAQPVDVAALVAQAQQGKSCFSSRRVSPVRSMVSRDGLRMICEYEAPDAEVVRLANQLAGLPYDRVWSAQVLGEE